jgi:hypothetical protein
MRHAATILPLSRTLSPPGLIKIFGRPVYSGPTTSIRAALSTTFAESYSVLPSGTGMTAGERQPFLPVHDADACAA